MSPSSSQEPPPINKRGNSVAIGDSHSNYGDMTTPGVSAMKNKAEDKAVQEVLDISKTRVQKEDELRYEADQENETKNDWTLAAAVLDRICVIAFVIIFTGGTIIFFAKSITHA